MKYRTEQKEGILLNANEADWNLSSQIIEEIKESVGHISFNRYPDNSMKDLLNAYGRVVDLDEKQLLAGNGSDQMLGMMIGSFLGKGKVLYTLQPDFSMYDYYADSYEAVVRKYETKEDGEIDIPSFIEQGKKVKADMVLFSNPNNPTGHCLNIESIEQILNGFKDIPVAVDEAYIEFANQKSALSLLSRYSNLYVTRTLSKAYGIAGVRIGFLASSKENMKPLKDNAVPYALNSLSMEAGRIVISHAEEIQARREETVSERERMYNEVKDMKTVHFFPSQANFLYASCEVKEELLKAFKNAEITVRNYDDRCHFRLTVGSRENNEKVQSVLKTFEETHL
jgi:histidinol-phosphate aminotransferase